MRNRRLRCVEKSAKMLDFRRIGVLGGFQKGFRGVLMTGNVGIEVSLVILLTLWCPTALIMMLYGKSRLMGDRPHYQ